DPRRAVRDDEVELPVAVEVARVDGGGARPPRVRKRRRRAEGAVAVRPDERRRAGAQERRPGERDGGPEVHPFHPEKSKVNPPYAGCTGIPGRPGGGHYPHSA